MGQIDEAEEHNTGKEQQSAEEIKQGDDQTAAVMSKITRLFVWGCNEKKQLGLNSDLFDDQGTDEANSNGARSGPASSTAGSQDVKVPH